MLYSLLLLVHATAGFVALASFWLPLLTRKGGRAHRWAGRWFVRAMFVVGVTAVPLAARFFVEGRWRSGIFLTYLFVITFTSVGRGWFALRYKQAPARYFGRTAAAVGGVNLLAGGFVLALGFWSGTVLLTLFAPVGLLIGAGLVNGWRHVPTNTHWWLVEHLSGMIGAGIAAHVAFGSVGLERLSPDYGGVGTVIGMLPWLTPLVVGLAAIRLGTRRYRHGLAAARA
jgi:hypothetical protein